MSLDPDVKCPKDVDVQTCEYIWAVNYNHLCNDDLMEMQSPYFYAINNDSIEWCLRLEPLNSWDCDKGGVFYDTELQLVATRANANEIKKFDAYGGEVSFCVGSNMQKPEISHRGAFILNEDKPKGGCYDQTFVCVYKFFMCKERLAADFTVKCEITFFKLLDAISLFVSHVQGNMISFEIDASNPLEDFGKLYLNEENSDVTICVKSKCDQSKQFPAHKIVLMARSKVFESMFKNEMCENKLDRIVVEDIREEVFLEALRYIYTGYIHNFDSLVYELLPVADRYGLEKLKNTCGNVLCKKLTVETAMKIVTLAHMYTVCDLKRKAIQFIRDNSCEVIERMDSAAWDDLMATPHLMKDILIATMN